MASVGGLPNLNFQGTLVLYSLLHPNVQVLHVVQLTGWLGKDPARVAP